MNDEKRLVFSPLDPLSLSGWLTLCLSSLVVESMATSTNHVSATASFDDPNSASSANHAANAGDCLCVIGIVRQTERWISFRS